MGQILLANSNAGFVLVMGVKIALFGSKKAFFDSEIADFEAVLAFLIKFFNYLPPYWPYMMIGHVGGPPWYLT